MNLFGSSGRGYQTGTDHLRKIKEFHKLAVEPYLGQPTGCRLEEVTDLEKRLGFGLPLAYKQYLVWMGRDTAGILKGSECFLSDVGRITKALPGILRENGIKFQLPEHYFVFFCHQGYRMAWFDLPMKSDDPPIWCFNEGQCSTPNECGVFTAFILDLMQKLAPLLPQRCPRLD